jgi:parallel beta-helix repeat protein
MQRHLPLIRFVSLLGLMAATLLTHAADIIVDSGDSIQAAVTRAKSGDVILIKPGEYKETVYIDKDNITLRGIIREGKWPTLEGEKKRNDAILYSGNGVTIENLKITHYKGNGIMGQAGNNYVIRNNWIVDTGVYGIFPQYGKNGLVEYNVLSGIEDAAIYIGMCDNIDVRHNEVYDNVAGIEIENSRHAIVENNFAHHNTGGILAFITPGLPIKTTFDVIIRNNFVVNNNHKNFGAPGSIVSNIPPGTGILVMAADEVTIEGNIITGNNNAGITITSLDYAANVANDPESEPNPDRIRILDNFMQDNGNNVTGELKALMLTKFSLKGPDIVDTEGGKGSCILNKERYRAVGLGSYGKCDATSTAHITSYRLKEPVQPREISQQERGKLTYYGVCAGCHAYSVRMIGPPTMIVQALYQNNAKGLAEYIANPVKKRSDFPAMPPQNYLPDDVRMAVAEFMLTVEK